MDRTRKNRAKTTEPTEAAPPPTGGIEFLEDRTRPIAGRPSRRRLGASVPGALAGAFLITALALGASSGPHSTTRTAGGDANAAAAEAPDGNVEPDGAPQEAPDGGDAGPDAPPDAAPGEATEPGDTTPDGAEPGDGDAPDPAPEATPKPDAIPEPTPGPDAEPTPAPRPAVEAITLALRLDGGKVVVDWGACDPAGFVAWKVVRSTDSTVTYPRGANDTLVAAIESMTKTSFVDAAPAGKALAYRVFGLARHEGESYVACRSVAREITTPRPEPKPEPTPVVRTLGLTVSIKEGHPFVDWTSCEVDRFSAYKIVRSTDSTVRWPLGAGDTLAAAVGPDGATAILDARAPAGRKVWYRVFCVRSSEGGSVVLAASAAKAVVTPAGEPDPKPEPDPEVLDFAVTATADGIVLDWQACGADGFAYYKVVRSQSNANPMYPLNDGTQLIAVIENAGVSKLVDTTVEAGQAWHYRVLCFGYSGDARVLRGITPVRTAGLE